MMHDFHFFLKQQDPFLTETGAPKGCLVWLHCQDLVTTGQRIIVSQKTKLQQNPAIRTFAFVLLVLSFENLSF